jgi:hypothetical protein
MSTLMTKRAVAALAAVGLAVGGTVVFETQTGASGAAPPAADAPTPPPPPDGVRPDVTPNVVATNATCGETITASLTLNGDLSCPSSLVAITIGAKSVTLNLNGHTIDGGSTSITGVSMSFASDVVEKGLISNFVSRGVDLAGSTSTVTAIRAVNDGVGIVDQGTSDKITNNIATGNSYGIVAYGYLSTYSGNHLLNNSQGGMFISDTGGVVTSNIADGNGFNGIWDANGLGVTLTKNTANYNGALGINGAASNLIDGGGNLAKGNTTSTQCYGVVCS